MHAHPKRDVEWPLPVASCAGCAVKRTSAGGIGHTAPAALRDRYYFSLKPGVDVGRARLDLGRMVVKDQLEPVIVAGRLALQLSTTLRPSAS